MSNHEIADHLARQMGWLVTATAIFFFVLGAACAGVIVTATMPNEVHDAP